MDWPAWAPTYRDILSDFGYDAAADEAAARELAALLPRDRLAGDAALTLLLQDRVAVVVGPALAEADRLPVGDVLLACDGATTLLRERGVLPHVVVTDLDGAVQDQVDANAAGAVVVVHGHGDNVPALREWVPRLRGPLVGTCQCRPEEPLRNFGGFTDGDRACALAAHFGARRIALAGFEFAAPVAKPGRDPAVKARKLAWARRVIASLDVPIEGP